MHQFLICIILINCFVACQSKSKDHDLQEVSECLGDILWKDLNKNLLEYDLKIVLNTIKDNAKGKRIFLEKPQAVLSKHVQKLYEKNSNDALNRAEKFLENLSKDNDLHVIIPGKLFYRIINPGCGVSIEEDSSPLMHFSEKDLDGDILFDTYKTNTPLRLKIAETILGFKSGVKGMKIGEKREIFVHPDFAYKKLGKTKPNQLIIYDITIIDE